MKKKMHVKKVWLLWSNKRNPASISSSDSLIVITLENGLQNMFKVNGVFIFNLQHIFRFS